MTGLPIDRRQALAFSALAGAGLAVPAGAAIRGASGASAGTCTTPRSAVARTQYGPVRGYVADGVLTFKGVPYGDDTGGENRWLPAKPPKRWTEDYPALAYGANCPQTPHPFRAIEHTFLQQWTDGFTGEDMLKLNVWTPSLSGSRPVMVYFHGGGFSFGSSYELASHDGAQMARYHDVVQVSVNHRLNVLGFLDVRELGGEAYAESVNVGMTDCVAALRWVQENIAAFGGDPDKVMIYGQSGGGSKVTTLLGMPAAKGAIHRAAIQSGGGGNIPDLKQSQEYSRRVAQAVGAKDLGALQKLPWQTLFDASNAVAAEMNGPMRRSFWFAMGPGAAPRVGWGPTHDGRTIVERSFHDVSPAISRNVPLLIGLVSEEGMSYSSNPSEAEWRASLAKDLGDARGNALADAMQRAHPEKSIRTLSYGVGGYAQRNNVQRMVKLRHDAGGAPAYQYWFTWQSPQLGGQCGAWHTAELAFCFDNTKLCDQGTGNTPDAQRLARTMAGAWASFARVGSPSQPGLVWGPSDPVRAQTMILDARCRMEDDPDGAVRRIIADA